MHPRIRAAQHCRCSSRKCDKRFKGRPGVTCCPRCGGPGRLDRWAQARPWRAQVCRCDAYAFNHRHGGGACQGPRVWPLLPGIQGLPF